MRIPRVLSILVLIITLLPAAYFVLFFVSMFSDATASGAVPVFGTFDRMLTLHLVTTVLLVAIPVFYVTHAFNNQHLPSDKRLLWVIVLIFGSSISASIYWFCHIWNQRMSRGKGA